MNAAPATPRTARPRLPSRRPFVSHLLAAAITTAIAGIAAPSLAQTPPRADDITQRDETQRRYLIDYDTPGLLDTARAAGLRTLDTRAPAIVARRAELQRVQAAQSQRLNAAIGRELRISHHYLATHNGIAAWLTREEADTVRRQPGVKRVTEETFEQPSSFRSATFLGADRLWDGSAAPHGIGTRGEGTVLGMLDTGILATHPSFADDAACGFGTGDTPSKLLSALDCSTTDADGLCNGPIEGDPVGHGTHVASIAAGNVLPASEAPGPRYDVSGIAPCAHIRSYKVCVVEGCATPDIQAGLNSVLLHGDVDVMNFSISGGIQPWLDNDRRKLDLVAANTLVVAAAGNENPFVLEANHRGPWVLSVAASTHDGRSKGLVSASGPGTPPTDAIDAVVWQAEDAPPSDAFTGLPLRSVAGQPDGWEGCTAGEDGAPANLPPFPAGFFAGGAALVANANCPLATQIENVQAAGASLMLLRAPNWDTRNTVPESGIVPSIPVYGTAVLPGDALRAYVDAHPGEVTIAYQPVPEDAVASFSLRGPIPAPLDDLTKPDLTAPGVAIYAGVSDDRGLAYNSGTSMASPNAAGVALLVRALQPKWTAVEVASALRATARPDGLTEALTAPWTQDQVGHGRVDAVFAANAGLVLHETTENFLAADPSVGGVALRDLNLPSARDTTCTPDCTWTRTLRNTLHGPSRWQVTASGEDVTVHAEPAELVLSGSNIPAPDTVFIDDFDPPRDDGLRVLTIHATPQADLDGRIAYGDVLLREVDGRAPDQRITVAISGTAPGLGKPDIDVPEELVGNAAAGGSAVTVPLTLANVGNGALHWQRAAALTRRNVWTQERGGDRGVVSSRSSTQNGGIHVANDVVFASRTALTRIHTPGFDASGTLATVPAITWAIYPDDDGKPAGNPETAPGAAAWTYTAAPGSAGVTVANDAITLDLTAAGTLADLPAGTYWLSVFPTYPNTITGSGAKWSWSEAELAGERSMLIAPRIYGMMSWTTLTAFGTPFRDVALTLDGKIGGERACGAPWLSLAPTEGSIPHYESRELVVTLDPAGLAPGTHVSELCIDSNDEDEPTVIVPVSFTVN